MNQKFLVALCLILIAFLLNLFIHNEIRSTKNVSAQSAYPPPVIVAQPTPTHETTSLFNSYPPPIMISTPTRDRPPSFKNGLDRAFEQDLKAYSSKIGVNLDEAKRRLLWQNEIGELNKTLSETEIDTFAGLWIQHQPFYQINILFTKKGETNNLLHLSQKEWANFVWIGEAKNTLHKLEADRDQTVKIFDNIKIPVNSAVNILNNSVELFVTDINSTLNILHDKNLRIPDSVILIPVRKLEMAVEEIYGGLSLPLCTSGFSVMNASGIKGITTAGHCDDIQNYLNIDLPFMGGNAGGVFDIQWNRADLAFDVRNLIWDGLFYRYIFNSKNRAYQSVGEWVCKYGKMTGYACGIITATNQDGFNIRVNDMNLAEGDSGGPWFWNNTAYGTTISYIEHLDGSRDAIYGPVDNIFSLGLIILPAKVHIPFVSITMD